MNKKYYSKPEMTVVILEHRTPFLQALSDPEPGSDPSGDGGGGAEVPGNNARRSLFLEEDDFIEY